MTVPNVANNNKSKQFKCINDSRQTQKLPERCESGIVTGVSDIAVASAAVGSAAGSTELAGISSVTSTAVSVVYHNTQKHNRPVLTKMR